LNGLRWRHATDARGFRNPDGVPTQVLLLGDSMIYGHGVEEPATVAGVLRREHAIAAYDMSRQGSCLYDDYVLLRLWLERLRPRQVVLFVFVNDCATAMLPPRGTARRPLDSTTWPPTSSAAPPALPRASAAGC
jgi:hypothetical protein